MGTPSYLLRPRLAPFATSGCPFYMLERGWAQNWPPPRSRGLKVTLLLRPFPPSFFAVKKSILAEYIWAPVEGLWRVAIPGSPTCHLLQMLRQGSYTLKGQSCYTAATAHISGLCESTACPYTLCPAPLRSKGLSH